MGSVPAHPRLLPRRQLSFASPGVAWEPQSGVHAASVALRRVRPGGTAALARGWRRQRRPRPGPSTREAPARGRSAAGELRADGPEADQDAAGRHHGDAGGDDAPRVPLGPYRPRAAGHRLPLPDAYVQPDWVSQKGSKTSAAQSTSARRSFGRRRRWSAAARTPSSCSPSRTTPRPRASPSTRRWSSRWT